MKKKFGALTKKIRAFAKKFLNKRSFLITKGTAMRILASSFFVLLFALSAFYVSREIKKDENSLEKTCGYLNSLDRSEEIAVWSNKREFCEHFKGKCFWGFAIPSDTDLDYIVSFVNQIKTLGIDNGNFGHLIDFPKTEYVTTGKMFFKTFEKSKIIKVKNIPQELVPVLPQFTFAIIGDSQRWPAKEEQANEFELILEKIRDFHPAFILAMGDLTSMFACREAEKCKVFFEKWRDEVKLITPNVYPAVGNHDYENGAMKLWQEIFKTPGNGPAELNGTVFSFDYKNSHFIFLNSEKKSQQEEASIQTQWMNEALKNTDKKNKFVISHRPNFPSPSYTQMHKWKTFFENKVFAYFSGHVHAYCYRPILTENIFKSESRTLHHFMIGNSGSKPMPIPANCEQSSAEAHFAIVFIKGSDMSLKIYNFTGEKLFEKKLTNEYYYK